MRFTDSTTRGEKKKREKSRILGEHRDFLEASGVAPINQVSDGALYRELE